MTKNILNTFLVSLVLLLVFAGCSHSDEPVIPGSGEKQEDVQVSFSLNLPAQFATRTMSPAQEEQIDDIYVLAFQQDGSEYRFAYWRQGTGYTDVTKTFKVALTGSPSNQRFMVLANARDEIMDSGILAGDNVNTVLGKIGFTSDNEWSSGDGNGAGFQPIPMYGITDPIQITATTSTLPVTLTRALAKVNISLLEDITTFELKTAQVFNRVTQGYIGYKQAGTAWIPLDASDKPYKTYLPSATYTATGTGQASNITNQIYILESPGTAKADYMEATAIVVGGLYKPDAQTSVMRYYRIDLTSNGLVSDTPTDILRTNRYDIQIQAVTNEGALTAREAFEGVATLKAAVVTRATEEENTSSIIIDGSYYLKISHSALKLGKKGNIFTITAETNYNASPNTGYAPGIRVGTNDLDTSWAKVSDKGNIGSGNIYRNEIEINVPDYPTTDGNRYTIFTISAGNMTQQISIYQDFWEWLGYNMSWTGYNPGDRGAITMYSGERYWKIKTVEDPSNVLVNASHYVGKTGGNLDEIVFYIRSTAQRGTSAKLTLVDVAGINPDVEIYINVKY